MNHKPTTGQLYNNNFFLPSGGKGEYEQFRIWLASRNKV